MTSILAVLALLLGGSVSPAEFRAVHHGDTRAHVRHVTGATGVKVGPGEWRFRTTQGRGTKVLFDFVRMHKEDPMTLTEKRWCTRDFSPVWGCTHRAP